MSQYLAIAALILAFILFIHFGTIHFLTKRELEWRRFLEKEKEEAPENTQSSGPVRFKAKGRKRFGPKGEIKTEKAPFSIQSPPSF